MSTAIIDKNGEYVKENGSVKTSSHRVFNARIEIALPKGGWLHAPNNGHNLNRFETVKDSVVQEGEFNKEVSSYLSGYSPQEVSQLTERGKVKIKLEIEDDA